MTILRGSRRSPKSVRGQTSLRGQVPIGDTTPISNTGAFGVSTVNARLILAPFLASDLTSATSVREPEGEWSKECSRSGQWRSQNRVKKNALFNLSRGRRNPQGCISFSQHRCPPQIQTSWSWGRMHAARALRQRGHVCNSTVDNGAVILTTLTVAIKSQLDFCSQWLWTFLSI